MTKIAVLMAGQGAQVPGMGRSFADACEASREIYDQADRVLGFPLSTLCFEGPADRLEATDVCQPAILVTSLAIAAALESSMPGLRQIVGSSLGLSLGEYSALVFAGALSLADGIRLVRRRGELMQEASTRTRSGMASVMGLDRDAIEACCAEASSAGIVSVANLNAPGQIVISGEVDALDRAEELCKKAGARRVMRLKVAGAFHSEVMRPAEEGLRAELADVDLLPPVFPVVQNVSARSESDPGILRDGLGAQLCQPVRWAESLETCAAMGITTFLEFGPGKVGTALARKTLRDIRILNLEHHDDLTGIVEALAPIAADGQEEQG